MLLQANDPELLSNLVQYVECVQLAPASRPASRSESAGKPSHSIRFATSDVKLR